MVTSTQIRRNARRCLKRKWETATKITILYFLINVAIIMAIYLTDKKNMIEQKGLNVLTIILMIISIIAIIPMSYGITISFMKLKRNEKVKYYDFLIIGFSQFKRSIGLIIHTAVRVSLPIITAIVSTIILMISIKIMSIYLQFGLWLFIAAFIQIGVSIVVFFRMTLNYIVEYNIAYDRPDLSTKHVVKKSKELMKNKCGDFFVLLVSFSIWIILTYYTYGLGLIFLVPYIMVSQVCFYENLNN